MVKGSLVTSGRSFYTRFTVIGYGLSCVAPIGVCLYLIALLHLTPEQLRGFWLCVAAVAVASTPVGTPLFLKLTRPLRRYSDVREEDSVPPELVRQAFAAAVNLPRRFAINATAMVAVPASALAVCMKVAFDDFPWQAFGVVMAAGLGCAPISALLQAYALKFWLAPLREELALRLDDPEIEAGLVKPLALRTKLQWAITATTAAPVLFALLYGLETSYESVEGHVFQAQPAWLESAEAVAAQPGGPDPASLARAETALRSLGLEARMALVDGASGDAVYAGEGPRLTPAELARIGEAGGAGSGSSAGVESANLYHWRAVGPDRALVVFSPRAALQQGVGTGIGVFSTVLLVALAFGWFMGRVAARDVALATDRLVAEALRIAGGDLGPGRRIPAEDELGTLGRTFERMRRSLRETVFEVMRAADRVESGSGTVHEAAGAMSLGAEEAAAGLSEASRSMTSLRSETEGVGRSASSLSSIVDQSGSASEQLLAGSRDLSETALAVSSEVDAVGSSFEEMVRTVGEMRHSGDALRGAADETSSSIVEMARSMREVDETATQTAGLAERVTQAASRGRDVVDETVAGMAEIREATEGAQEVIRDLGENTGQIGAILDVIDSVADETSLLALNAAIIAAQSGEQGRAFAVVADEIKQLANRVLSSTKEITDLIGGVQKDAADAVVAIGRGAEKVARGVELARNAGESLAEIDQASRESGTCIQQIATAVREQTAAAAHVVSLMEQVLQGVEQIQRSAEEHERGSESVLRASAKLREGARQVASTTGEQAGGSARIRDGVEGVREAVAHIEAALLGQAECTERLAGFIADTHDRTSGNRETADSLKNASAELGEEAVRLRGAIGRFRL
ncbi:MAG: methyl-accepting chemotaxis protein [Myxococcota bacterium]